MIDTYNSLWLSSSGTFSTTIPMENPQEEKFTLEELEEYLKEQAGSNDEGRVTSAFGKYDSKLDGFEEISPSDQLGVIDYLAEAVQKQGGVRTSDNLGLAMDTAKDMIKKALEK